MTENGQPAKKPRQSLDPSGGVFAKHSLALLIARRVRENGVLSILLPGDASLERIESHKPKTIILSGGPNSVHVEGAPRLPDGFFEYVAEHSIPVLGICYGMQLLVHSLGGEVSTAHGGGEYGRMPMTVVRDSTLFGGEPSDSQLVWMSHGDEAVKLPEGFTCVARSEQARGRGRGRGRGEAGAIVAIESPARKMFGLQYHPEVGRVERSVGGAEVVHSERGKETLRRFLFDVSGMGGDWRMENVLEEEMEKIRQQAGRFLSTAGRSLPFLRGGAQVGPADHVICALSGGVDSTVAATLVHRVLGDRLHCVFVDNGLLRYKEAERGTLYPDVIESCPPPGKGQKHSHTIKSHHNVGGLPEDLQFELIEPLRELFKDEVRSLGRLLGVPEQFIARHPFPGPGLAVRVIGDVTQGNALDVLREVDECFINCIREKGLYDEIWQAFAVFLPVKSVGVQGDQRTHSHVVALRAVTSSDGMTADCTKIVNTVKSVNRVVYDITSKPPGTIEWE
eukprot:scaffold2.g7387.t1